MFSTEKRLNKAILRKKILKEINFILKQYKKNKFLNILKEDLDSDLPDEAIPEGYIEPVGLPGEAMATTNVNDPLDYPRTPEEETLIRARRIKCADEASKSIENEKKAIEANREITDFYDAFMWVAKVPFLVGGFVALGASNLVEFVNVFKNTSIEDKKRALILMKKDIIWVLENDPETAVCFLLDLFSIADPTGLADISQGIILINKGDYGTGILCLLFGLYQLATSGAAAATEGALLPLAIVTKVEIWSLKLGLKSGKGAIKIIEMLADPTLARSINRLRQSGNPEYIKAASALEKSASQARRYKQFGTGGAEWYARAGAKSESEVLEKILNGKLTNYNPGISDAARFEIDRILRANKPPVALQAAMASISVASTASTGREKQGLEQKELFNKQTNQQIYDEYQNRVCSERPIICNIIELDINSLKLHFKDGVDLGKYGEEANTYLDIANAYLQKITKEVVGKQVVNTMSEIDKKLSEFEKENIEYYSDDCRKYIRVYPRWRRAVKSVTGI